MNPREDRLVGREDRERGDRMKTLSPEDLLTIRACRSDFQDMREGLVSARASLDSAIFFAGRESRDGGVTSSLAVEDIFTAERWLLGLQTRVGKTVALLATVTVRLEKDAKVVCNAGAACPDASLHSVVDETPSASKPKGA